MASGEIVCYTACPVCESNNIARVLQAKDYTVSNEMFAIWECHDCSLRFTQDIPDENSIARYYQSSDYISHSDNATGPVNQLYKIARKFTLRNKRKLITNYTSGKLNKKLLDIGAGTGAFASEMQQSGWAVTGLEPDDKARKEALNKHGISLFEPSQLFHQPEASFSAVTMWHVLEHVHQLHQYLATIGRLLQAEGKLFIAVPNYTCNDCSYYQSQWAAYDVPRHLYHFSPQSMQALLQQHQLRLQEIKPMHLDAFYIALLSEKYKTGKTRWIPAAWQGLRTLVAAGSAANKASSLLYIASRL